MSELRLTPAGIAALANGDFENFMVASRPGGIEAQEAAGQVAFCASETLPKDCPRADLEKLGVVFGKDFDDLFIQAKLPPGWKKKATDHPMWSNLVDDRDRKRGGIFYKAAFYDRSAHMRLDVRYYVNCYTSCDQEGNPVEYEKATHSLVCIMDAGQVSEKIGVYARQDYAQCDVLEKKGHALLDEKYPEHKSVHAYWD